MHTGCASECARKHTHTNTHNLISIAAHLFVCRPSMRWRWFDAFVSDIVTNMRSSHITGTGTARQHNRESIRKQHKHNKPRKCMRSTSTLSGDGRFPPAAAALLQSPLHRARCAYARPSRVCNYENKRFGFGCVMDGATARGVWLCSRRRASHHHLHFDMLL